LISLIISRFGVIFRLAADRIYVDLPADLFFGPIASEISVGRIIKHIIRAVGPKAIACEIDATWGLGSVL
jgi:hypothetical protein